MAYDFTEDDFTPKSKFDFTEEDFTPTAVPLVRRNRLGESKEDLKSQADTLRAQGAVGNVADKLINAGMWGSYLTPFRGTAAKLLNIPGNEKYELPPLGTPEEVRQSIAPITQSMGLTDPVTQGATEFAAETGSQLTTPDSIETLALGPLGAGSAAARLFQAQMIKDSPQAIQNLIDASKTGDIKETTKAGLGAAMAIGGPLGIERGLTAPPLERGTPTPGDAFNEALQKEPIKPVTEPVTQPKENNARSVETAATSDGGVLLQPEINEGKLPAKEGDQGVPSPEKEKEVSGLLTPDQVDKMSTADLQKRLGRRAHAVGIEYGLTLSEKDVPELQAKYDSTMDAIKKGASSSDMPAIENALARQTYYGGALQGATRGKNAAASSNYELYLKEQAANKARSPQTGIETLSDRPVTVSPLETLSDRPVPVPSQLDNLSYRPSPESPSQLENLSDRTVPPTSTLETLSDRPAPLGLQLKQPSSAMGEAGAINVSGLKDFFDRTSKAVKGAFDFTKEVGKEVTLPDKMTDYRRSVLGWSAKLQRSFGEAASIQRDLTKQVKDPIRRDAITNWIQADGDPAVLRSRASQSEGRLAKGYEAALKLTPEELNTANQIKQRYAALAKRGQRYDVLDTLKDNYVTQIWDLGKGPTGSAMGRSLKQKFRFSKARTFDSFFSGEQSDFVPKTKDISKLLPVYMHEMESVIAARELVEDLSKGTASDGRPLVASKGVGIPVENPGPDKATLVMPKTPVGDTKDYKVLPNQPALENWKWVSKDDQGNPIFLKADLALHPEAYNKLKNVLGKSVIKEWYQTPTSAVMAIPKAIVHGLDRANSEAKKLMLGLLSPFHQVQEGTHAVGHRVNPTFNIPKIDLVGDQSQMDAARHGLMLLPDKASENQFMEGFKQSKIISLFPGIGPASDWYSHYLFHEYIPGLKYKTYQSMLDRNTKLYAKDVAAGKVGVEDVKVLSSEQANAAFGHLNYADLGRNPTIQHIAQLGILAPDFFESRIRFSGQAVKGATGLKVGREQILALATLAIGQAALAYTSAKLTGGKWDEKHPFEMTKNGKRYTLRSVPEDIQKFIQEPRQFLHNRLSILGKGALQYSSGVNYKGQKVTAEETTKELAQQPIPLAARGFMHIGDLSGWDQLLGAVGLKVSKASPRSDVMQQAHDWAANSTDPKVKAEYERRSKEVLPDSVYKPLRQSLEDNDKNKIIQNIRDILSVEQNQAAKVKRMKLILKNFEPFSSKDVKPFATRSKENEVKFLHSLDEAGKSAYRQAIKEQVEQYRTLTKAIYGRKIDPPVPDGYNQYLK